MKKVNGISYGVRVRLALYATLGITAVLATAVLGGCSASGSTDGKMKWFAGVGYEQDRKENFNGNWGSEAYGGGSRESHNPWADYSGGSAAIRR